MIDNLLPQTVFSERSMTGLNLPQLFDSQGDLRISQHSSYRHSQSSDPSRVNSAISAEGIVSINQSVSFAGDPIDLKDDALIYAGRGVNINQVPTFSLMSDLKGNPILDQAGRVQVRENALMLGEGYSHYNFPNHPFSQIGLPKVVTPRTIEIPEFSTIKNSVLTQVAPASSSLSIINPTQNPINSIADAQRLIPSGSSASQPKLIRVTGGGLNLPDGVSLENVVIVLESGDLNFNGSTARLKNVVLIAENGSINLGSVQAEDVTILASQSIHMNQNSRFIGRSLLANGDTNGILFNGATVSKTETDHVTVISQGRLTFNAAADTRGLFLSRGDFSFNSSVELVGQIQTKANLFFNGAGSVRSKTIAEEPKPLPEVLLEDVQVVEGNDGKTQARFVVELSTASDRPVSVKFATQDGTAIAGLDYQALSGTLTFAPGETEKVITVDVLGDRLDEALESFKLSFSEVNGAILNTNQAVGEIIDDDEPASVNRPPKITSTAVTNLAAGQQYTYDVNAIDPDNNPLIYSLLQRPQGMTIDPNTGMISWDASTQTPGKYEVKVQVSDGLGGLDTQTFAIDLVNNSTGEIQGMVWNDLNRNGVRDSALIQGSTPDIVFVIDTSGSVSSTFRGTPVGDINGDRRANTILDAELAGLNVLNQLLIQRGFGNQARVSVIAFGSSAVNLDMDPSTPGVQLFTNPSADRNGNGILDVAESFVGIPRLGGTNFERALGAAERTFTSLGTASGQGNLIFLSDGAGSGAFNDEVTRLRTAGINIAAYGAGTGARLSTLQRIDPNAAIFNSTDELLNTFSGLDQGRNVLEPGLANVTVYLDLNNNGKLDTNEPFQLTSPDNVSTTDRDESGQYLFANAPAGNYQVRAIFPTNYRKTFPSTDGYTIDLTLGQRIVDRNFGLVLER